MHGESAYIDDLVVERPDGTNVLLEVSGTPVKDEKGNTWASLVSFSDITDRKRSEAIQEVQYNIARSIIKTERVEDLLEMIRNDLSKVLDTSNFIVALYNSEKDTLRKIIFKDENDDFSEWPVSTSFSGFVVRLGKTLFMNRQEIEVFARDNNLEIIGTPAACWIGVPISIQNRVIGVLVAQSYTNTEAFSTNDVALLEMVGHEISIYLDRKQMLDDLIRAKEKAEESDLLKTAFINNISHEIRTPLNGILGFGQFLADPGLTDDERQTYFGKVQTSSNRLLNTVNDYMDIARIVSGTLTVVKKSFILRPSLSVLIEEFRMLCIGKYLDFELVVSSDDDEIIVFSDVELVHRILHELLDNAVKFTTTGKISMGYQVVDDRIEFFIRDTGKGISAEKLSVIFDIFTQEDASMTRGHEGSGLGLSIVKGIVGLLGGTVWVESEKGSGATFYFTLPYGNSPTKLKPAVPVTGKTATATKPLVLVAEDDESNFMYLEVVIKKAGCDYILVQNGEEAVETCRQNPDITFVLMDIKMPVMNGLEATKLIREFRPNLPIIALTAYAQTGDGYRMLQAGCDEYLPKPVKPEVLKNLIKKYTQIN
jgi:signal transduction histidine kinase